MALAGETCEGCGDPVNSDNAVDGMNFCGEQCAIGLIDSIRHWAQKNGLSV